MLGEVEVLLGHEHALAKEVLVDLLAVSFRDKPRQEMLAVSPSKSVYILTLLRVPCAIRGIAHNAEVLSEIVENGGESQWPKGFST